MNKTFAAIAAISAALLAGGCSSNAEPPVTQAAEPQAITWEYLNTEYADLLNEGDCKEAASPSTCMIKRAQGLRSFTVDLKALPPGKPRADAISSLESFAEYHEEFDMKGCVTKSNVFCDVNVLTADLSFETVRLITAREAKAGTGAETTTATASPDDIFEASLDAFWSRPGFLDSSKDLAQSICGTFKKGSSEAEVSEALMPIYEDAGRVSNLIAASTKAYCPEFSDK